MRLIRKYWESNMFKNQPYIAIKYTNLFSTINSKYFPEFIRHNILHSLIKPLLDWNFQLLLVEI